MNQHHLGKHDRAPQASHFKNAGAVAAAGTGIAGVEVDVDHLRSALTKLQGRHDEFAGTVANAAALADDLPNGTGPTAEMMGQFYQHRVGDTGGVQYALNAHLSHLDTIVTNLSATITNYRNSADEALRAVQDAPVDGAPTS